MQKGYFFIAAGYLLLSGLIIFGLREAYLRDKREEVLLYNVCHEAGCTDAECQLFASLYDDTVHLKCPGGTLSR